MYIKNFQTGEGLWKNIKAFGKSALGSLWGSVKKDARRQLDSAANSAASAALDRATEFRDKYDDKVDRYVNKYAPKDGKNKIFSILSGRSKTKRSNKGQSNKKKSKPAKEVSNYFNPTLFIDDE